MTRNFDIEQVSGCLYASSRKCLELAAMAYGCEGLVWVNNSGCFYYDDPETGREEWLPHLRDGQCARLEDALGIDVTWHKLSVMVDVFSQEIYPQGLCIVSKFSDFGGRSPARRFGSVHLAALIQEAREAK